MPWRRISKEQWSNDSNKHVFYDAEAKLLCTEAYPIEPGLSMVVIPKDVLEELMKENRYHLFPEAEFLAMQRLADSLIEGAGEESYELDWYKDALFRREQKTNSLTQLNMSANRRAEAAAQVVEITDHNLMASEAEIRKLHAKIRVMEQDKLKIIEIASKEIDGLRAKVAELEQSSKVKEQ